MDNFREEFIKGLLETLKIPSTAFNIAVVSDEIEEIPNQSLRGFYREVVSADTFGNGMKAIIKTAENYKQESELSIKLTESKDEANDMYNKFYSQNCSMTDYAQANRNKVPNDREFFEKMDYSKLKNTDGQDTYTKQELYVLRELGGGSWLADIRFLPNTQVAISKIERIIKDAKITKYESLNQIESKRIVKMLKGVA